MSDEYPVEKYRQARLTLMHMYIYETVQHDSQDAIRHVLEIIDRIIKDNEE